MKGTYPSDYPSFFDVRSYISHIVGFLLNLLVNYFCVLWKMEKPVGLNSELLSGVVRDDTETGESELGHGTVELGENVGTTISLSDDDHRTDPASFRFAV